MEGKGQIAFGRWSIKETEVKKGCKIMYSYQDINPNILSVTCDRECHGREKYWIVYLAQCTLITPNGKTKISGNLLIDGNTAQMAKTKI